jgi:single-strand DNA-binding protein
MFQITVIGNLGQEADLKDLNGKKYTAFRVAANVKRGQQQETTWVSVLATYRENLQPYLTKGTQVYVCGDANIKAYAKHDGTACYDVSVFATNIQLLGKQESKPATQQIDAVDYLRQQAQQPVGNNDKMPF